MELKPIHFIGEPIEVHFEHAPLLEKKPGCPDSFSWRDEVYQILEVLSEWHDYQRRGRMARNMQSQHATVASHRGSWGVGQDYYRVRTKNVRLNAVQPNDDRFFDLYYDRAPTDANHRKGGWFLDKELSAEE